MFWGVNMESSNNDVHGHLSNMICFGKKGNRGINKIKSSLIVQWTLSSGLQCNLSNVYYVLKTLCYCYCPILMSWLYCHNFKQTILILSRKLTKITILMSWLYCHNFKQTILILSRKLAVLLFEHFEMQLLILLLQKRPIQRYMRKHIKD